MKDNTFNDRLSILKNDRELDIDIAFGFLDRSYTVFNFKTQQNENVDDYNLTLDLENIAPEKVKDFEAIVNSYNKLHDITLILDGILRQGKAKIAQTFGISGYSINLEIHS